MLCGINDIIKTEKRRIMQKKGIMKKGRLIPQYKSMCIVHHDVARWLRTWRSSYP